LFDVTNGTKQGCVLASLLCSIFAMMLLVVFKDCDLGVNIGLQFRTDGNVFDIRTEDSRPEPNYSTAVIRD